jgi:hypothetical protein
VDLVRKFDEEATCDLIPIDKLQVDVQHTILRAERVYSRYEPSIVLTLRGPESRRYRVYLPRRYCDLITDEDIKDINDRKNVFALVYKGTCRSTNQHLLRLVQETSV